MRLFIAIILSDEMKGALTAMQRGMIRRRISGNYTKTENFHLTLAFIGEYNDPGYVLETVGNVPFEPVQLSLDGIGSFGDLWWAGIAESDELNSYVRRLRHTLADAGIPFDRKKFSPHITLVRKPSVTLLPPVEVPRVSMTAERVSLMRSDRGKNGMIYTEIGNVGSV